MKKKILIYSLFACAVLLLQSCLKDDDEVFDQSAALRMQAALKEYRAALKDARYGWLMEYYPDKNQSYGGYNYVISFTDEEATVGCELVDANDEETSMYQLIADNGPVLTFNTYNSLMHYFATPAGSSALYQARGGDYEFIIMDVTDDLITLKGKKTGNKILMHKLTEPKETYLAGIIEMGDQIITDGFSGSIGGQNPTISMDEHVITFTTTKDASEEVEKVSGAYILTPTGLKFYEPIVVSGKTLTHMKWDNNVRTLTCTDENSTDVVLQAFDLPDSYVKYSEFIGSWTLTYRAGPKEISIEQIEKNKTLLLKGLNDNFNVVLNYSKNTGSVQLLSQIVEQVDGLDIWICPWDTGAGYYAWGSTIGFVSAKDITSDGLKVDFIDNGAWGTNVVSGLLLRYFPTGTTANGGNYTAWGSNQYVGNFSMTKNN